MKGLNSTLESPAAAKRWPSWPQNQHNFDLYDRPEQVCGGLRLVGLLSNASALPCHSLRVQLHAHFLGTFEVVVPKPEAEQGRFARELSALGHILQSASCSTREDLSRRGFEPTSILQIDQHSTSDAQIANSQTDPRPRILAFSAAEGRLVPLFYDGLVQFRGQISLLFVYQMVLR